MNGFIETARTGRSQTGGWLHSRFILPIYMTEECWAFPWLWFRSQIEFILTMTWQINSEFVASICLFCNINDSKMFSRMTMQYQVQILPPLLDCILVNSTHCIFQDGTLTSFGRKKLVNCRLVALIKSNRVCMKRLTTYHVICDRSVQA